ncbi:MAG TPA: hypothetical protein VFW07_01450 [Parafilimonas sp.]|nr:hypothetical protein [Parafilimonas sp.]
MNYKVKATNLIKRLTRVIKRKPVTDPPQQPCINQLYAIDFVQGNTLQKNVIGRYTGPSRSGKFMKFQLQSFFTSQGIQISLLCLDKPPIKLRLLKQSLFSIAGNKAA